MLQVDGAVCKTKSLANFARTLSKESPGDNHLTQQPSPASARVGNRGAQKNERRIFAVEKSQGVRSHLTRSQRISASRRK